MNRYNTKPEQHKKVKRLREAGYTRQDVANILGLTLGQVDYAARLLQIKVPRKKYEKRGGLHAIVDRFDSVMIEKGFNGGYIATLGEQWTGSECGSISRAVTSAEKEVKAGLSQGGTQ